MHSIPSLFMASAFNSMMSPAILPMIGMQVASQLYLEWLKELYKPLNQ